MARVLLVSALALLLWAPAGFGQGQAPTDDAVTLELRPVPEVGALPQAVTPPTLLPLPDPKEPRLPLSAPPVLRTIKAYYVGYADDSFEAVRRSVPSLDIVAGQWLSVDAAGCIHEAPEANRNDAVRQMVQGAGKKVYTCVVNLGFSRAVVSRVLHSAARRTAVIDRIVRFVLEKGDEGVDLDFEGIRAGHGPGYSAFVRELGEKLHARGKELSVAVDATFTGEPGPGFDFAALARYADSLMPMSYTFGPGRVPACPIGYLEDHAREAIRRIPAEKLMIGIGLYGRNYNLRTGRKAHPTMSTVSRLIARHEARVVLDPGTLTKRFSYLDEQGRRHLVYFDDPETIRAKLCRLAERYGVSSVGFWRMGQEAPSLWDVLDVALGRTSRERTASARAMPAGPPF